MHTEANNQKSLLRLLSGDRDTCQVQEDMQDRGIRPDLWVKKDEIDQFKLHMLASRLNGQLFCKGWIGYNYQLAMEGQ
jgi:hypothetical protein